MIRVNVLRAGYPGAFQLEKISFEMPAASFWGVIGPNGSGKSTLLKALSKIMPVISGTVEIDGKELQRFSLQELARQMAVVGSEAHFAFPFHVIDVVRMGRI